MFHSEKELELWEFLGKPSFCGPGKKSRKETEKKQPESPGENNKKKYNECVVGIKMTGGGPKIAEE